MSEESKGLSKEDIQSLVKEEVKEYFRMARPGFEIISNYDTMGHGVGEFALSTDTAQGFSFYKQGNGKLKSNKSMEIMSGYETTSEALAIGIHADNGVIYLRAMNGDLILEGNNVKINTNNGEGTVSINGKKQVSINTPNFKVDSTNTEFVAKMDLSFLGGNTMIHSEMTSVEISNGDDEVLNGDIMSKLLNITDILKKASIWS